MNNKKIKIGSNKSFGIVFFVFFLILALYFFYKTNHINYGLLITSFIFLVLGLLNSKILSPLNYIWFKFGFLLSLIVSPVVMSVVFFFVVTPIAIIAKIFGKDFLKLKKKENEKKKSFWISKEKYDNSMKDQF